jgi:hypothetical protein
MTQMMRHPFAICLTLAALAPLPCVAQTYDLPKGCTAFLTIQGQGCQVRHLWTCTSDTEGEFWFASMGVDGVTIISQLSYGSQNLFASFPLSGRTETIAIARDPVDFDAYIANGQDSYDYDFVDDAGAVMTATGEFTTIDGTVEIDGRSLQQFERRFVTALPGQETQVTITTGYVDSGLHTFYTGRSWYEDNPKNVIDRTPVDFIFPGEPGFLSTLPSYGCGG